MRNGRNKQSGVIISAELVFILTILVIGLLVGWVAIRDALVAEMHDTAEAIGELDQSYFFQGTNDPGTNTSTEGAQFNDAIDDSGASPADADAGDRTGIDLNYAPDNEDVSLP